ncbi:MAG: ATP-dependent zinc protease [Spirochaetales bacterium]|nr:ATP-dependent zinc protease [Spirochaetales bacterium]
MDAKKLENKIPIGWREWISLPEWNIDYIKVKVDTGARTSSLHVEDLEYFENSGEPWVRFSISPRQKSHLDQVRAEAKVIAQRDVRSSSGYLEKRPVIQTSLIVAGKQISAEITLTNRDKMGFRMLLGREAIRKVFLVIAGVSYLGGKPPSEIRNRNRMKIREKK